jgi:hypothetical protein
MTQFQAELTTIHIVTDLIRKYIATNKDIRITDTMSLPNLVKMNTHKFQNFKIKNTRYNVYHPKVDDDTLQLNT